MDEAGAPVAKNPAEGGSDPEAGALAVVAANEKEKGFAAAAAAGLKAAAAVVAGSWKLPTAVATEELNGFKAPLLPLLPLDLKPCAATGPLLLNPPCGCCEEKLDAATELSLLLPFAAPLLLLLVVSGAAAFHDLKAMPTTTSLPAALSLPGDGAILGVDGDSGGRPPIILVVAMPTAPFPSVPGWSVNVIEGAAAGGGEVNPVGCDGGWKGPAGSDFELTPEATAAGAVDGVGKDDAAGDDWNASNLKAEVLLQLLVAGRIDVDSVSCSTLWWGIGAVDSSTLGTRGCCCCCGAVVEIYVFYYKNDQRF